MSVSISSLKTWYLIANRISPLLSKDITKMITGYVDDRYHMSSIPKENKGKWFYVTYQANAKGLPVNRILKFGSIPPMSCSIVFPNFGPIKGTTITLNSNNILQGTLVCTKGSYHWNGYASKLFDGQLELYCVTKDAFITGNNFRVEQCSHIMGDWPGFMLVYE